MCLSTPLLPSSKAGKNVDGYNFMLPYSSWFECTPLQPRTDARKKGRCCHTALSLFKAASLLLLFHNHLSCVFPEKKTVVIKLSKETNMESIIPPPPICAYTYEPLYATVNKARRSSFEQAVLPPPPPEFDDEEIQYETELEAMYGGKPLANTAAIIIQRAYRNYKLQSQFSQLLRLAKSTERLNHRLTLMENDEFVRPALKTFQGTQRQITIRPQSSPVPENIDQLLLEAAGLSNLTQQIRGPSERHLMNRKIPVSISKPELKQGQQHQQYLRRTTSLRVQRNKHKAVLAAKDDLVSRTSPCSSPVPPPCPPLKGFYHADIYGGKTQEFRKPSVAPRPPQRTVSFLEQQRLPQKIVSKQQEPIYGVNFHARTMSCVEYGEQTSPLDHSRSNSSPAPLSPPIGLVPPPVPPSDHVIIDIEEDKTDLPLPPPPYISPPASRASPPLPPPPPQKAPDQNRQHCDSSSSTSSIDSGFRSSVGEHGLTHSPASAVPSEGRDDWIRSPNFIGSPNAAKSVQNSVFEPRSVFHDSKHNLQLEQSQSHVNSAIYGQVGYPIRNVNAQSHYQSPQDHYPLDMSADTTYSDLYGRILKTNSSNSNFPRSNTSIQNYQSFKVKKSVRIQAPEGSLTSTESALSSMDDLSRRRQYRVGLNLFNQNPERGMDFLIKKSFLEYSPASAAKFLKGRKGLSRKMVGEYLCSLQRPFNLAVLHSFVHEMDFSGLHLDIALRQLYEEVTFPGEAQKVEKMIEVFSRRYIQCNQMFVAGFNSPDTIFVLAYAMVLLNTDLHSKAVRSTKRMKRDDFVQNLRGIDSGADVEEDMVKGIYDRIKTSEFKPGADHVSQVARLEEAIQGIRKRGQPSPLANNQYRRLVCFCRLTEVTDINKPNKKSTLKKEVDHQRGVFLFNDLIIVAKTITKGKKTSHQYKYCLQLRDMRINVFCTHYHQFGIQLQDRLTGRVVATFNARSDTDRQRFVNDLQEASAEISEMERANAQINDSETLC